METSLLQICHFPYGESHGFQFLYLENGGEKTRPAPKWLFPSQASQSTSKGFGLGLRALGATSWDSAVSLLAEVSVPWPLLRSGTS